MTVIKSIEIISWAKIHALFGIVFGLVYGVVFAIMGTAIGAKYSLPVPRPSVCFPSSSFP